MSNGSNLGTFMCLRVGRDDRDVYATRYEPEAGAAGAAQDTLLDMALPDDGDACEYCVVVARGPAEARIEAVKARSWY